MKNLFVALLLFIALVSAAPSAEPEANPFFFKTVYVPYPAYSHHAWKRSPATEANPVNQPSDQPVLLLAALKKLAESKSF